MSHYLKKYPDKTFEGIYDAYFDDFIENLTAEPQVSLTYCSGLAGVFETLRMMNESSLVELDFSEIETAYNNKLWSWVNYCFGNQNYDFLHGALGVSMYFRNNPPIYRKHLALVGKNGHKRLR